MLPDLENEFGAKVYFLFEQNPPQKFLWFTLFRKIEGYCMGGGL